MTARELIARRARVLKYQVLFAVGGLLAIAVLNFVPVRLDMRPAAFTTAAAAPWWPWLVFPVVTYLLGVAAWSAVTGRLVWPLTWLAAVALRGTDAAGRPVCARCGEPAEAYDDIITEHDCVRADG